MLEKFKRWFSNPHPGEYTEQDERILEHDNAQYLANLETEKRLQERPRVPRHFKWVA